MVPFDLSSLVTPDKYPKPYKVMFFTLKVVWLRHMKFYTYCNQAFFKNLLSNYGNVF